MSAEKTENGVTASSQIDYNTIHDNMLRHAHYTKRKQIEKSLCDLIAEKMGVFAYDDLRANVIDSKSLPEDTKAILVSRGFVGSDGSIDEDTLWAVRYTNKHSEVTTKIRESITTILKNGGEEGLKAVYRLTRKAKDPSFRLAKGTEELLQFYGLVRENGRIDNKNIADITEGISLKIGEKNVYLVCPSEAKKGINYIYKSPIQPPSTHLSNTSFVPAIIQQHQQAKL